ncbi:uncharacterized protein PgNI_02956, partial [Pyricularia grisea]|uniref:Uncharacterized protein n=1 Tax=Pyricularia grisea TaxID=148305 RepID=A0A6P8BDV4_PYRGI
IVTHWPALQNLGTKACKFDKKEKIYLVSTIAIPVAGAVVSNAALNCLIRAASCDVLLAGPEALPTLGGFRETTMAQTK